MNQTIRMLHSRKEKLPLKKETDSNKTPSAAELAACATRMKTAMNDPSSIPLTLEIIEVES
jgi:hypothetical protein